MRNIQLTEICDRKRGQKRFNSQLHAPIVDILKTTRFVKYQILLIALGNE